MNAFYVSYILTPILYKEYLLFKGASDWARKKKYVRYSYKQKLL